MMDRLQGLNASQKEAVTTLQGPLLVLAGAGTGKTRVITVRMAELIRNGVPPDRILSVTFTNKAAREMAERTRSLLGRRLPSKPVISTFHSLCVKILRQTADLLGYPKDFAIYDRGDQESTARSVLRDIRVQEKQMRPGELLSRISRWKMAGVLPQFATEAVEDDLDFLAAVAYRKYQAHLKQQGAVDFDDLLLLTTQLFAERDDVLDYYQQRFHSVQIDEYQDTNGVQFELVQALVREHNNICVVGDDDQSIYGWRGAEVEHILNFQNYFPGAKVVRLEENYRCTDKILEAANRLVRFNSSRHDKTLYANKQSPNDIRIIEFPDEVKEAEGVVGEIEMLRDRHNVPLQNIAVLFRTNEQPRLFETEFRRKRIPYVLIGGSSFFDRKETRDLLAYLKTIVKPTDEISLLRIINTPARGIGGMTIEKILARAVRSGQSFWDAVPAAAQDGEVNARAVTALNQFHSTLDRYRRELEESPQRMGETVKSLIQEIGYESEIAKQYKEPDQQQVRMTILEQFVDSIAQYAERTTDPTLNGFLEETALTGRDEENDTDEQMKDQAVRLMTMHSAKGLEFPMVYLVGMEEGLLPHHRSLDAEGKAIEEERRLAYVGVTRAMDYLTLTRAAGRMKWGKRRDAIPSRFLDEMMESASDRTLAVDEEALATE